METLKHITINGGLCRVGDQTRFIISAVVNQKHKFFYVCRGFADTAQFLGRSPFENMLFKDVTVMFPIDDEEIYNSIIYGLCMFADRLWDFHKKLMTE